MADRRRANVSWNVADEDGRVRSWDRVAVAVLMDIRDELQRLNQLLHCSNFIDIPRRLSKIAANTTRPKRKPRMVKAA